MTDHKKPGWAFWAVVLVVVLVGYPLSLGPVNWLYMRGWISQPALDTIDYIYTPLDRDTMPEWYWNYVAWCAGY
jgi:hypothetical protein